MTFLKAPGLWLIVGAVLARGQIPHVQDHQAIFESNSLLHDHFENHFNEAGFDVDLDALRLVQFSLDAEPVYMTERQKLQAKALGMKYLDITDVPSTSGHLFEKQHFSYPPPNSTLVPKILPLLSIKEMKSNLRHFTSFRTRYYNSDTGKASSEWLLQKIRNYTTELASPELQELISVEPFVHKWKQTSVIVRIAPETVSDEDPITVIGAHCDSINHQNPFLPAPGADDDGSGTVTILEALRVLLKSGYVPNSPLEFHFYSAEEGGLLGSLDVVAAYEKAEKQIKGMHQFDMTAWVAADTEEVVNIITTDVDPELTQFLTSLADRYVEIPWVQEKLIPGAGSDHISWTRSGYQSCVATEALMINSNFENIHTANDSSKVSREFSFEHMQHFSRLAVGFAVEMTK
ncbi:hypothetical protein C8F01DRAFT_1127927 [Mycena amicta]|nr:hypothetical protein C8F01DRAFT_1127927 [Mycena amicta]